MIQGKTCLKATVAALAMLALAACATGDPRPPHGGAGAGGTEFGYWGRDAEGAVDAAFRGFIVRRYKMTDVAKARQDLETDLFTCKDGNRPDATAVPELECLRMVQVDDDVHAWKVEFWPGDRTPRAHYTRTKIRDPLLEFKREEAKRRAAQKKGS